MQNLHLLRKSACILQKSRFRVLLILLLLGTMSTSCWKERFDLYNVSVPGEWTPDVCAPLVHSNMTLKDILNDYDHNNLFVEDNTHFLYLVYWNKVYSQTASEFMAIPDQNVNTTFPFSVTGALPYGVDVTAPPYTKTYSFTMPNNEILTKVILNNQVPDMPYAGILSFNAMSPNLNHNATINVSIPAATKGGVPFNYDIQYIAGSPLNATIDLSGYQIVFNGSPANSIDITYTVTVHGSGQPNNSPYDFNMNEAFQILSFHEAYGDFKQHTFSLPNDSVELRVFDHNIYGYIDFEDPRLHVWAYNSFGMPIRVNLDNLRATSLVNPPYLVALTGYPNPWNINSPNLSQIGQTLTTTFDLDKNNSNIKDASDISPKYFICDLAGLSNPAGGPSSNFVLDTSRFAINVQVELPLYGKDWDFRLADTLDFEFGENLDNVEFITIRVNTTNGFPVEGIFQVYFEDEYNTILDSLLVPAQQVLAAAPVGPAPDYRVTATVPKTTETTINQPRLSGLSNTTKIVVLAKLATINNGTEIVKFYSDYSLDVRLAARTKFKVNL